ncbi:protein Mis18-beta isoform X1 [Oenanthe melanoleuca]|uniref:protein Mis18-beta isoform X1 n=1 Tax=Oenanthe melanoleuca TaxID=2939378 RepID=UPI0024C17246|nr:protein Mis18-beta isoform X1 [Oenanthe melanoleuca]
MATRRGEQRSNGEAQGAGPAPERWAGGDGGAAAAAAAVPGPAAQRGHRAGAAARPRRCCLGLAFGAPAASAISAFAAVFPVAAGRVAGVAAAAAGSAAGGVRRVLLPPLLDGAGRLAAAVRAGAAGAQRPHLLQSVPRGGGGGRARSGHSGLQRVSLSLSPEVTSDVTREDSLFFGLEGALLGCAYYLLSCRWCGLAVGFILYSSGSDLAYLRDSFCFFKENIICYLLKTHRIIEASEVNFPPVTSMEYMQKVKEKLVAFNSRLELVIKKLEKQEQNNYVTEWQNSSADHDLLSAYARVNN